MGNSNGEMHDCISTSKTYLRFQSIPAKKFKQVVKPHPLGCESIMPRSTSAPRGAFWPGMGPIIMQTLKPQPQGKQPSFSKEVYVAHTIPGEKEMESWHILRAFEGWDELEIGKKDCGSRWERGFTELWATCRLSQHEESVKWGLTTSLIIKSRLHVYTNISYICVHIKYVYTHTKQPDKINATLFTMSTASARQTNY